MSKWIRENLVLISGIVLPILLVGGFFVLSKTPTMLADPPEYDFVLVGYRFDYRQPGDYYLAFEVLNGKLTGRAVPRDENNANYNPQSAGIYRYSSADNTFEEITYDLPENLEGLQNPVPLQLTETEGLKLDKRSQSPDGYTFEFMGYRGRGGLLGDLFGMRYRNESNYVLKKDGAFFDLPVPANGPYNNNDLRFMGWVMEEDNSS